MRFASNGCWLCSKCHASRTHRTRFMPSYPSEYVSTLLSVPFPHLRSLSFVDLHMNLQSEARGYLHGTWAPTSLLDCAPLSLQQHLGVPGVATNAMRLLLYLVTNNSMYRMFVPLVAGMHHVLCWAQMPGGTSRNTCVTAAPPLQPQRPPTMASARISTRLAH